MLERHGPLVRGVCRRVLRDEHRADDVFQAVFLVLAEKAGALQRGDLLANWLFGVARRMAHRAKRQAVRSERRERLVAEARPEAVQPPPWDDLLAVLEEELRRLPPKFRGPLLACYHQGRTQDEAAHDFGWHVRTLRRRLAKGRDLLRLRMERRGATLTGGLFAAALAPSVADGALPSALRDITLTAVLGGTASEPVKELVRGGLNMLALTKLKVWAGIGLIVAAILTAGGIASRGWAPALEAKPADPPPAVAAQPPRSDDPLPDGAVARLGTLRLRHGTVSLYNHPLLAFGSDDQTLLSGGSQFLRQWQVADGAEKNVVRFDPKQGALAALTTPDGKTAFQVTVDEKEVVRVHVFDTVSWKKVREAELTPQPGQVDPAGPDSRGNMWANSFVVAPDGSWLGTITGGGRFAIWDTTTGKHSQTIGDTSSKIMKITTTPDANRLAAMDGKNPLQFLNLKTGESHPHPVGGQLVMSTDSPWTVSPDGKTLAVATLPYNPAPTWQVVRLIPINDGGADRVLDLPKHKGQVVPAVLTKLAFTPDGKSLVYAANGTQQAEWGLLPIDGKDAIRHPAGPVGTIATLALSHDAKTVATTSAFGVIRLWDAATGKERQQSEGHRASVTAVAFQSNDSVVTAGADATIRYWDAATGNQTAAKTLGDGPFSQMVLSPNGRWLVQWRLDPGQAGGSSGPRGRGQADFGGNRPTADSTVQILETDTGKERYRLKVPNNWAALFSGGNALITLESDGTPKEWDLSTGKKLRVGAPVASGLHRLSGDGEILVTVDSVCVGTSMSDGKELFRWGLLQKNVFQETLGQNNPERVVDAAISPDGKTLALALWSNKPGSGRAVLCELTTGKILHELEVAMWSAGHLTFTPDGKRLVAASDKVMVWDVANGKLTRTLDGHRGMILALAFDRAGKRLATASADTTVLIWDMSK